MKLEMLVRVRYDFEGKEHTSLFIKTGNNDVTLKKGFENVCEMYLSLQKQYGLRNLTITTELIYDTRPMKLSLFEK